MKNFLYSLYYKLYDPILDLFDSLFFNHTGFIFTFISARKASSLDKFRIIGASKNLADYVRIAALQSVSKEIYSKNVSGSVAEVGVFRGYFARRINKLFPDRKLYLFDTFEGFNDNDIEIEKENNFSSTHDIFKKTDIECVLKKMKHPEVCVIKKGYFPNTAKDITDHFAFVSLDADLYLPIKEGLNFFYPKLSKGGYIFIHDYNNPLFKGAKKALDEFCEENHIGYFPLSDVFGSAVITKN